MKNKVLDLYHRIDPVGDSSGRSFIADFGFRSPPLVTSIRFFAYVLRMLKWSPAVHGLIRWRDTHLYMYTSQSFSQTFPLSAPLLQIDLVVLSSLQLQHPFLVSCILVVQLVCLFVCTKHYNIGWQIWGWILTVKNLTLALLFPLGCHCLNRFGLFPCIAWLLFVPRSFRSLCKIANSTL